MITQEISSEESSQDDEESDDQKYCDGICACSYKSINLISKKFRNSFKYSYSWLCAPSYIQHIFNSDILKINSLDIYLCFKRYTKFWIFSTDGVKTD